MFQIYLHWLCRIYRNKNKKRNFEALIYAASVQNVLNGDIAGNVTCPFLIILTISIPLNVLDADSKLLKPNVF
jgi:hypothetical protein